MPTEIIFSTKQIEQIKNFYLTDKLSCKKIGKLFNCSKQTINKTLRNQNIMPRDFSKCQQKYKIDQDLFENIDTYEKAYWFGMLCADGHISRNACSLSLAEKDKEMVYKFRDFISPEAPVNRKVDKRVNKSGKHTVMYSCYIFNKKICNNLEKHTSFKNKTKELQFPNNLNPKFYSSFMLGFLDGDGWFKLTNNRLSMGIASTLPFVKMYQEILMANCDLNKTKLSVSSQTDFLFFMSYGGNYQILKIVKFLYQDSPIWLSRKKERAIKYLLDKYPEDEWLKSQNRF